MSTPSKYDRIHDEYSRTDSHKAGTRYERLAALVLKALQATRTVVHDLKLVGDSDVKHQIDVTVATDAGSKRVLIECKDFDLSGDNVGLSIVRDFWGVVDDVHPDASMIITCNGFTPDAAKYAKSKGIVLAVLRGFQEVDWAGRLRKIAVAVSVQSITEPTVELRVTSSEGTQKLSVDLASAGIVGNGVAKGQPVFLNLPAERIQLNEFLQRKLNEHPRDIAGLVLLQIDLSGSTIEVENRGSIDIAAVVMKFEVVHTTQNFGVTPSKVATLILEDLAGVDFVVFDEDLKRLRIDEETGEVHA